MSNPKPYAALVKQYVPAGSRVCNCREAYETQCGRGITAEGVRSNTMWACTNGCDSAKHDAVRHVVKSLQADYLALRAERDELQVLLLSANDLVSDEIGCTLAECVEGDFPILAAGFRKAIDAGREG